MDREAWQSMGSQRVRHNSVTNTHISTIFLSHSSSEPVGKESTCNARVEKAMAPHSSTLAWKIPWAEEAGRLQSMGSLRVGHD